MHLVHNPIRAEQAQIVDQEAADQAINHTIAAALRPALNSGATIERATLWPWVLDVSWCRIEGIGQRTITIVQRPMHQPPDEADVIPADGRVLRGDVFPATRFDDMTPTIRLVYRAHYRALLMWRRGMALGKAVDALQPWTDYDPVTIDEIVERWAKGSSRYAGD